VGQMGRNAVLGAVLAGIFAGGFGGVPWAALGAVRPAAAQEVGAAAPALPVVVGAQVRVAPGEPPPRHVLADRIDRLIDRVVALNEHYGWRWSETGALIAKLEEAFLDLDNGRPQDAAHQLRGFRDRISTSLADGTLAPEAGGPLLAATADLLDRVETLDADASSPVRPHPLR